jgi:hypothetical protein
MADGTKTTKPRRKGKPHRAMTSDLIEMGGARMRPRRAIERLALTHRG